MCNKWPIKAKVEEGVFVQAVAIVCTFRPQQPLLTLVYVWRTEGDLR